MTNDPWFCFRQLIAILLAVIPNYIFALEGGVDSTGGPEEIILKKVALLRGEIRALNLKMDSLQRSAFNSQSSENSHPARNKPVKPLQIELETARYRLWEWMNLLSEARRLSYAPENRKKDLHDRILQKIDLLGQQKDFRRGRSLKSEDLRMDFRRFPAIDPMLCHPHFFEENKIATTGFIYLSGHSDPLIENQIPDRDFAMCSTRLFTSGSKWYADWEIEFASEKASSIYGLLDASVPLKLEFMDGSYIYLFPSVSTHGEPDPSKNTCVYKIQTQLDRSKLRMLRKKEFYSLTVIWEKGKEKFDVYHISAFQKLISCLDKRN